MGKDHVTNSQAKDLSVKSLEIENAASTARIRQLETLLIKKDKQIQYLAKNSTNRFDMLDTKIVKAEEHNKTRADVIIKSEKNNASFAIMNDVSNLENLLNVQKAENIKLRKNFEENLAQTTKQAWLIERLHSDILTCSESMKHSKCKNKVMNLRHLTSKHLTSE